MLLDFDVLGWLWYTEWLNVFLCKYTHYYSVQSFALNFNDELVKRQSGIQSTQLLAPEQHEFPFKLKCNNCTLWESNCPLKKIDILGNAFPNIKCTFSFYHVFLELTPMFPYGRLQKFLWPHICVISVITPVWRWVIRFGQLPVV